jgi:aminoglycoside phosphotransferase (APT) family kinase protein
VIAWHLFTGESRAAYRKALDLDPETWARGRGWALWKALIMYAALRHSDPATAAPWHRVIDEVLADEPA